MQTAKVSIDGRVLAHDSLGVGPAARVTALLALCLRQDRIDPVDLAAVVIAAGRRAAGRQVLARVADLAGPRARGGRRVEALAPFPELLVVRLLALEPFRRRGAPPPAAATP